MEYTSIKDIFADFIPTSLHCRFLCGSSALREARIVSRMQLYLALSGLDNSNALAQNLVSDIRRFETAREYLLSKNSLNINIINETHSKLLPGENFAGKLRTSQTWIGNDRKAPAYVPPPADQIKARLSRLLEAINQNATLTTHEIIKYYCNFLIIHPFLDGNGRISRLLIDYMQQRSDLKVHFSLFRLGMNIKQYQNAVLSFGVNNNEGVKSPYWQEMLAWAMKYQNKSQQFTNDLENKLKSKLALSPSPFVKVVVSFFMHILSLDLEKLYRSSPSP